MGSLQRAWRGGKSEIKLHLLSVFSVSVAFLCLGTSLLVVFNLDAARGRWASTGRASVYLHHGAPRQRVEELERALRHTGGVREVRYVSGDEARRELVKERADPVLESLPAEAFPASLELELVDDRAREQLEQLATKLGGLPMVESLETYQSWSGRLGRLLTGGVTASLLLALVVLGAVISVVSATIRLALQRRRTEVELLKLVGATDGYIRRPFVIEGAAQGTLGAMGAIVLLGTLYAIIRAHIDVELARLLGMDPTFLPLVACLGLVLLGTVLGAAAAYGSLRRLLVLRG
jgi:cell division transport system permease protein